MAGIILLVLFLISCAPSKKVVKGLKSESAYSGRHSSPKIQNSFKDYGGHSEYAPEEHVSSVENRKGDKQKNFKMRFKVYSYVAAASGGLGWIYPPAWLITIPVTIMAISAGKKMNGMEVFEDDHLEKIKVEERLADTTWVEAENYRILENMNSGVRGAIKELRK